jgi:integrase
LAWRHESAYNADASPTMMGKKPLNRNSVQRDYLRPESIKAGLTPLGWHGLRHSYRTWLAEKGTGPEVQRDLMQHSTIAMSLDGYGRGVPHLVVVVRADALLLLLSIIVLVVLERYCRPLHEGSTHCPD